MALEILKDIALTIDDAEIIEYQNNKPITKTTDTSSETPIKKSKRPRFKFSMVGIKIGDYVTFDPLNIKVKVATDDAVEYDQRIYKLSSFVGTYLPEDKRTPSNAYQGAKYFSYNGKVLNDLRHEMENSASAQTACDDSEYADEI